MSPSNRRFATPIIHLIADGQGAVSKKQIFMGKLERRGTFGSQSRGCESLSPDVGS